jgi:hypothetical protein
MKPLSLLVLLLLAHPSTHGQGTVNFANLVENPAGGYLINAPVYAPDLTTKLDWAGWVAQLYVGPPNMSGHGFKVLKPVGDPSPFQTGLNAGFWVPGIRVVPGVTPGSLATLGVAVWELWRYPTYEAAVAANLFDAGSWAGSQPSVLGGNGLPPALLEGMHVLYPIPEASPMWLGVLGVATLACGRLWPR